MGCLTGTGYKFSEPNSGALVGQKIIGCFLHGVWLVKWDNFSNPTGSLPPAWLPLDPDQQPLLPGYMSSMVVGPPASALVPHSLFPAVVYYCTLELVESGWDWLRRWP